MKIWRFALIAAIGCVLGGLMGEFWPTQTTQGAPQLALLIDTSGSMSDGKLTAVQQAAAHFVQNWDLSRSAIAVVGFDSTARVYSPASQQRQQVLDAIAQLKLGDTTNMAEGVRLATNQLPADHPRTILLFTDGQPDNALLARAEAYRAQSMGVQLVAIGTLDADKALLAHMTGRPEWVFSVQDNRFEQAFAQAGQVLRELFRKGEQSSNPLQDTMLWGACIGLGLGLALQLAENLWGLRGVWWRDLWWVAFTTAGLGAMGAWLGQWALLWGGSRSVGWGILGLGVGLCLGLADRSSLKAGRGALGGAIGGFLGGTVFSMLADVSGLGARMLGFAVLGACIGAMVFWVQQALGQVWLYGTRLGPYEGVRYNLTKAHTRIGRGTNNDIALVGEADLPMQAGIIEQNAQGWLYRGVLMAHNGQMVEKAVLKAGDRLRFGASEFIFQVRGQQATLAAWQLNNGQESVMLSGKRWQNAYIRLEIRTENIVLTALQAGVECNRQPVAVGQKVSVSAGDVLEWQGQTWALLQVFDRLQAKRKQIT